MSIAEKLTTLAENEQAISNGINAEADLIAEIARIVDNLPEAGGGNDDEYNAIIAEEAEIIAEIQGMVNGLSTHADTFAEGYTEGEQTATAAAEAHNAEILADCNAVLPSKGAETAETLEQVPQRIGEIEYSPNVLLYAKTLPSYSGVAFPEGYELTLNIPNFTLPDTGSPIVFSGTTGIKWLKLVSSATVQAYSMTTAFYSSTSFEELDMTEFPRSFTSMASTFLHCRNLRKILGELDLTQATFNTYEFYNCSALEELRIKAGTLSKSIAIAQSDKLSAETIQSIIDGLAQVATAQKLTLHASVGNKLTDAQKAQITAKNWTLVY